MTEAFWCSPGTITLLTGYTPIQNLSLKNPSAAFLTLLFLLYLL